MTHHHRARVLAVSLALCVALLACGLSVLFIPRPSSIASRAQQLADARNRWLSRPVPHYRLVMQAPSWCRLDVEIQSEKVVRVFENSCPTSPRTVTGLFDLIKQLDSTAETPMAEMFVSVMSPSAETCALTIVLRMFETLRFPISVSISTAV